MGNTLRTHSLGYLVRKISLQKSRSVSKDGMIPYLLQFELWVDVKTSQKASFEYLKWSVQYFIMFHFIVVEMVRRVSIFLDIYGFPYANLVAAVFTFPLMCWKPLVISPIVFSCVLYRCLKHFKILRVKVNTFVIFGHSHILTGTSLSEALLFAEHGENMLWTEIVLNVKNHFCTQHVLSMFWAWNSYVLNFQFNEQSVLILWVSWCKNKSFWQRFTCTVNYSKV